MKNLALTVSGVLFLTIGACHLIRYYLGMAILLGTKHHVPVEASLYLGGFCLVLALWMFIAALVKHRVKPPIIVATPTTKP